MNRKLMFFLPRLQDIFFMTLFVAVLMFGNRMINLDGDLPRHLAVGRLIISEGQIPLNEPLIYPYEDHLYVSHEWLSQVIYQVVYSVASLPGLVLLAATLIASTFFILYSYLVKRLSMRLPVLFMITWGAFATSLSWAIRPHLFSMLLLAIWLVWTDRLRNGEEIAIWRFPVLMLVWSNFHGIFIAGVLVLFAFTAGWTMDYLFSQGENFNTGKRLWLTLILSTAASVLNPGGADSWFSIFGFVNNRYLMSRMVEANSPDFQDPEMRIILMLLSFSIFLLAVKRGKFSNGQGFLLAGFTAMSLMAFRNIQLYGIVVPFVLAEAFTGLRELPILGRLEAILANMENRITGTFYPVLTMILLGTVILTSPNLKALYRFDTQAFPVNAVTWLMSNQQKGNMFNDLNWGGYLELNLYPQKTFVDSVVDVTGEVTMNYETILTTSSGWDDLLRIYDIKWVIIPVSQPLADALLQNRWTIVYQDKTAVILNAP